MEQEEIKRMARKLTAAGLPSKINDIVGRKFIFSNYSGLPHIQGAASGTIKGVSVDSSLGDITLNTSVKSFGEYTLEKIVYKEKKSTWVAILNYNSFTPGKFELI